MLIERIGKTLPQGIHRLVETSLAEGINSMAKLEKAWHTNEERFDCSGAGLFAAFDGQNLVGIGGVTPETDPDFSAMRMRRFYVLPDARRQGVAFQLAQHCMRLGLSSADTLTCNAQASEAAGPFWQKMGFVPIDHPNVTHVYRLFI